MNEETKATLVIYYGIAVFLFGALCDLVITFHPGTVYLR